MSRSLRTWARVAMPLAAAAVASVLTLPTATAATPAETAATAVTCYDSPCITGIRAATHTDYDRLVFDLTAPTRIFGTETNTTGAYTPMSGLTEYVTVKGTSYLFITMEPAHLASGVEWSKSFGLPTIKGVQLTNFHAARAQFGLSLGPSTRYNVFHLTQPDRVVVDVYR
ncbi:hypothetical protein ACFFSH_36875 [Streptomyces filamentosus]|uniref:AMIN-like domain-containing protein n=1 Tax=Streptomyces filamentosus TaxID=67294 RepID=A0A919BR41_STRFL|nr:hypothetical protein [Streptomyces filamentosus]GHG04867.1 hypothetical protein GCM10017667_39340 [Streptomyces filamentosus]